MNISCAIIDDEPLAAQLLESYVGKTPYLKLKGTYGSALAAMRDLRENPVDLIFLDIQMPELSGVELARILPDTTKIIFTTAFSNYAVEGFRVSALDYLLKPITYTDFLSAADKALQWFVQRRRPTATSERFMFIRSDYKLLRVRLDDILYIEGLKDYVRFYLKTGEKIMALMSMRKLEERLPHPDFMRTHRSYIVNMAEVSAIDRLRVVVGEERIPISDGYKEELMRYLDRHTLA